MPLNTAKVDDFSGGINLVTPVEELEPSELNLLDSTDLEISANGKVIRSRRPIREFTISAALPTPAGNPVKYISSARTFRLDQNSPDKIILSNQDGIILTLDPNVAAGTLTTVLAAATTAEYEFVQSQDSVGTQYVWISNGVSTPQKYNISTGVLSAWGGAPPNGTVLKIWKNMMIVAGVSTQPQRLYYSKIADPETTGGFIDIKSTDDESDAVIALEVVGENLIVFKQNSVWVVFDSVSFDNRRLENVGCVYRSAVAKYRERVYWVAIDGVYSTDGDKVIAESINIAPLFLDELNWTAASTLYSNRVWTRLIVTAEGQLILQNAITMAIGWVLSLNLNILRPDKQHPWFAHTSPFNQLSVMVPGQFRDHNVAGAIRQSTIGFLVDAVSNKQFAMDVLRDSGGQDKWNSVTTRIYGSYKTRWMPIQGTENFERVRRVNVVIRAPQSGASFDFRYYVDFGGGPSYSNNGVAITSGIVPKMVRFRPEARGRYHQMLIGLIDGAELHSVEMKYRGGKEH